MNKTPAPAAKLRNYSLRLEAGFAHEIVDFQAHCDASARRRAQEIEAERNRVAGPRAPRTPILFEGTRHVGTRLGSGNWAA